MRISEGKRSVKSINNLYCQDSTLIPSNVTRWINNEQPSWNSGLPIDYYHFNLGYRLLHPLQAWCNYSYKKETIMKIYRVSALALLTALTGCSSDTATKYVFDADELKANTATYTLSKGEMDQLGCMFGSLLFSKEMQESVRDGKEPNIDNAENFSPATIMVSTDKIEWLDLAQETPIVNGTVTLTGIGDESIDLQVVKDGDSLAFGYRDKKLECRMPFKKSAS